MTTKNRAKLARERAGLSLGQAAKILSITREVLIGFEESDALFSDGAEHVDMADIYGVNLAWLLGDAELRDYASIDAINGADRLTVHDRDVLAEFAASIPRSSPCRIERCTNPSSFFALDNRAPFGHVCFQCYRGMSKDERALYGKRQETA